MPTITMRVRGSEQLRRNLGRLGGAQRRQAQRDGLEAGARVVETHAKVSMAGSKHGRTYTRGNREHTASAPGEAPAIDIGNLVSSIQVLEATPIHAVVGTAAEYAEHLEFGTSRMEPRPFLRPALDEHEGEILDAIEAAVRDFVESIR